ncbi:cytochrome P450 6d1-like [Phlebotomus argentipes]|uniref:cytochrome P450 6d1-like n=1 Tax=Phlebotomus argentipes TaxID=94469 RepID=UPI0028937FB5|nr:cytochrome P450 6d1-like [Phlebotomus argentipes]
MYFSLIFLCIILALCLIHYLYVTLVAFTYWKRRGVASEKPSYPLGNVKISQIFHTPIETLLEDIYSRTKGPFMGYMLHTRPVLIIKDPEMINRILVKDFQYFNSRIEVDLTNDPLFGSFFILHDERWKLFRQKLSPIFAANRLRGVFDSIESKYNALEDYLMTGESLSLDFYTLMKRYLVNVMTSVLLGIDVDYLNNPNDEIRLMTEEAIPPNTRTAFSFFFSLIAPGLKTKIKYNFFRREVEDFVVGLVKSVMKLRVTKGTERFDFIHKLMELREDFPPEVLSAQVLVLVLAAYEGTGGTISYCLWELAKNPEIQAKAQEEVDKVLQKHGKITLEALGEMTYIDNCLSETLRLHPTLTFLIRRCNQDYHNDKYNLNIEKNTNIIIPLPGLHKDEQYYPDPHKFDPDRFLPEEKAKRPSGTYLPFGDGQRFCFGKQLAKLIDNYTVAKLLSRYSVTLGDKSHQEKITMKPLTPLLSPDGGCYLTLIERH